MSADLPHHYGWRWAGHNVGTSHTNGPQPTRNPEDDSEPYVPPEDRPFPMGFCLPPAEPVEPDPLEDMPLLYEGDPG